MRDTILEILEELRPDVDFEKETKLIDDKILESFDIVSLVSELTDEFDITIRLENAGGGGHPLHHPVGSAGRKRELYRHRQRAVHLYECQIPH